MPVNEYLQKNLGGIECAVQDSSYVLFNLYMRKMRQRFEPANHPEPPCEQNTAPTLSPEQLGEGIDSVDAASALSSVKSTGSDKPATHIQQVMLAFVTAMVELEHQPVVSSDRKNRQRFLTNTYVAQLGPTASRLMECVSSVNYVLTNVFTSTAQLSTSLPSRARRVEIQSGSRELQAALKKHRKDLEDCLNELNTPTEAEEEDHEDTKTRDALYLYCDVLYTSLVLPRISVAEMLLSIRTAVAIRSVEVCEYAQRHVDNVLVLTKPTTSSMSGTLRGSTRNDHNMQHLPTVDDIPHNFYRSNSTACPPSLKELKEADEDEDVRIGKMTQVVFSNEVSENVRRFVDAVSTLTRLHHKVDAKIVDASSASDFVEQLADCGIEDGAALVEQLTGKELGASMSSSTVMQSENFALPRKVSFRGTSNPASTEGSPTKRGETTSISRTSSASSLRRTVGGMSGSARLESLPQIAERLEELLDLCSDEADPSIQHNMNNLYDAVGQFNMFLRRHGLSNETQVDNRTGKVVPTQLEDGQVYIPHVLDDQIGLSREMSVLYEQACLRYEMWSKQRKVRQRFQELVDIQDDEFFKACHDDLLEGLFRDADDVCFMGPTRTKTERRLNALMKIRIKVFHHSGEIRAVTIPQSASLDELFGATEIWMPDVRRCIISTFDEGDKVRITSNDEFKELIRLKRCNVLEGIAMTMSQLSRSGVVSTNDLKLEVYVDPPTAPTPISTPGRPAPPPYNPPPETQKSLPPEAVSSAREKLFDSPVAPVPPPPQPSAPSEADAFIEQQMKFFQRKMEQLGLSEKSNAPPPKPSGQYRSDGDAGFRPAPGALSLPPQSAPSGADFLQDMHRRMAKETPEQPESHPQQHQSQPPASEQRSPRKPPQHSQSVDSKRGFVVQAQGPDQCVVFVTEKDHKRREAELRQHQTLNQPRSTAPQPEEPPNRAPSRERANVSQQQQLPQATASIRNSVRIEENASRWMVPTNSRPLEIARHQLGDSTQQVFDEDEAERLSDEEFERELASKSRWGHGGRGTGNHLEAVMNSGGGLPNQRSPMRHNGPMRRNGTPLDTNRRARRH